MESYIHLYKTNSEFTEAYNGPDYIEPWLSLTEENMSIGYNKPKLTAITFGSITWVTDIPATGGTASKDNCSFEIYAKYDNGISVDVSSDATVEGTLVVPSSTEGQRHEAGQLALTASYSGFSATGNVTVYQAAVDFSTKPLTFNILSAGTINWTASNTDITKTIDYKLNDNEWTSITSNTGSSAPTINVVEGDKLQFRGDNAAYCGGNPELYSTFGGSTAEFKVEGNIMSLINPTDFSTLTALESNFTFADLFSNCTGLTSAENLILPATTLAMGCYFMMFQNCSSLTTAPKLPATTLAMGCYAGMFSNCTSLTTAPKLPATTLANDCYEYMFGGCTSLTTAPALPATILADRCYSGMFDGCTSLTIAPKLPVTTLTSNCYQQMFQGCTSLTTAPKLPATTLKPNCYNQMFYNCSSLTTAPELPATTLTESCYDSMFCDCTSLTTAPALPATDLADFCYQNMFNGCTSLTTAPELPATTLASSCYSQMFSNCTSLTTVPELPATILATWCYYDMFDSCTSLATVPSNLLPATTLAEGCYGSMFWDCTSLTTAPELPATTLADSCYQYMFNGCTNLNYIKCLATDISASNCTDSWVYGVASNGTFVKAPSMTSWTTGANGIPSGWTVTDNKEPLTFKILSPGTINWTVSNSSASKTIEYRLNNGEWASITSNMEGVKITVNSGDKIQFRGNNATYGGYSNRDDYSSFSGSTAGFEIEGSIMSLINSTNFVTATTLDSAYTFSYLFNGCTGLTSAENLILPATALTEDCYNRMFQDCTSLTTAPALPATTLANSCYSSMFCDCTSLITAPELPATTLAGGCYDGMFQNCSSLNYIKCLATDISATDCTSNWVDGVAATGTFVKSPNMTEWTRDSNGIPSGWTVENYIDYTKEPLTFKISSPGTINWRASNTAPTKTINYKLNDGEWKSITSNTGSSAPTINVVEGDKLQFRGNNEQYATGSSAYNSFGGSALFELEGNIMSLIYGDDFKNNLTISSIYTFASLFRDCTKLVSVENLVLPATNLANYCYSYMFDGCKSLTTAPALPATTLASQCYQYMFNDCTSLTTAPSVLPATTLANDCYGYMFRGCKSLTTAPALPATTLANNCYISMFEGCTSLTTAPTLPATTLAKSCYQNMFSNCTSLTIAPKLPATTLANYCYSGMFNSCTSLTTAPALPATTLKSYCYSYMFNNCTSLTIAPKLPATTLASSCYGYMFQYCSSLTAAPELPATTLADFCYNSMFQGCTSLTTAPELPATTLANNCYYYMFSGCTSLNYIKCLATDISATRCTTGWVKGVASTGTFIKPSSMASWSTGDNGIPTGWTKQNA